MCAYQYLDDVTLDHHCKKKGPQGDCGGAHCGDFGKVGWQHAWVRVSKRTVQLFMGVEVWCGRSLFPCFPLSKPLYASHLTAPHSGALSYLYSHSSRQMGWRIQSTRETASTVSLSTGSEETWVQAAKVNVVHCTAPLILIQYSGVLANAD